MTYLLSSGSALIVDRNTWTARANDAWGASRVWNSGSSFEADLVAMTTDRNTWHTRADQAWGASRVWSSGESWEAAYNRVLPHALWTYNGTVSGSISNSGAYQTILLSNPGAGQCVTGDGTSLYAAVAGYYMFAGEWRAPSGIGGTEGCQLLFAGAVVSSSTSSPPSSGGDIAHMPVWYVGLLSAGQAITLQGRNSSSANPLSTPGTYTVTFIPTPTYPH